MNGSDQAGESGSGTGSLQSKPVPLTTSHQSGFVGREPELLILEASLIQALAGNSQVLLVGGDPGIGKTRLAEELAAIARSHDASVSWGRCYEGSGAPTYWPWIQILRTLLRQQDETKLRDAMGAGVSDVARLLPELNDRWRDIPHARFDGEYAQFRLFDSMTTILRNLASIQPLVFVLDDLQWSDRASLLLLEFVVREAVDTRLLLLGTFRDGEIGRHHPLAQTLLELSRQGGTQHLTLRGLSPSDTSHLVRLLANCDLPHSLVAAIAERTGGNPFFIREFMRLLLAGGGGPATDEPDESSLSIPRRVRDLIRQRVERVLPEALEVLGIAAVVGREFNLSLLAELSILSTERLAQILDEVARAQLIRELPRSTGYYRFGHDLTHEALYEDLDAADRLRLHGLVGSALERAYVRDPGPYYAELARHFSLAAPIGYRDKAIEYVIKAGDRAMARIAYDNAAERYQDALQFLDLGSSNDGEQRCEVLLALGEARRKAGHLPQARDSFQQAAELARRLGHPERLARAALGIRGNPILTGEVDDATIALLREASDALGPEPSKPKAQCLAKLALSFGVSREADRLSAKAVRVARQVGDAGTLALALHARHDSRRLFGSTEECMTIAEEMVAAAETAGDDELVLTGYCWRMFEPLALGDMPTVDELFATCEELSRELRQPFYVAVVTGVRAMRTLMAGDFARSEELANHLLQLGQRIGIPSRYTLMWWWVLSFYLRREQDRLDELAISVGNNRLQSDLDRRSEMIIRSLQAVILAEQQYDQKARQAIESVLAPLEGDDSRDPNMRYLAAHLAEAAVLVGDRDCESKLYDLLLPYAHLNTTVGGAFMCTGSVSHYLGIVAASLERWSDAERHFEDALAMNQRIGARPFVARTQYAYADMLIKRRALDDQTRASSVLERAMTTAAELGMVRLQRQASVLCGLHERVATGQRVDNRTAAQRPTHGLSPREIDVLTLLVEGHPDRDIAERLFVSPRTVQSHVSSIFNKLGVNSRAAATAAAIRRGII
jgi:DNA-binding CsgD family transcriptional regulator/tetratricopeptide (TPR) repeat protein